jgi:hypothetical protein
VLRVADFQKLPQVFQKSQVRGSRISCLFLLDSRNISTGTSGKSENVGKVS